MVTVGCQTQSLYEIWQFTLDIGNRVEVNVSTALFDPITIMNPANPSFMILTRDALGLNNDLHGCNREAYSGPVHWYNARGSTEYHTNAFGDISGGAPVRQEVSKHDAIGIPMSPDQTQFKFLSPSCAPGLGLKN